MRLPVWRRYGMIEREKDVGGITNSSQHSQRNDNLCILCYYMYILSIGRPDEDPALTSTVIFLFPIALTPRDSLNHTVGKS